MNFIAASLLYHAEEYIAFWLLVFLVESFEMRDIFLPSKRSFGSLSTNKLVFRAAWSNKALSNH